MKQTNRFLNRVLAAVLTIAALATGQEAAAVKKTVTYTFTAESTGSGGKKLTFTPSGDQFGTKSGAKEVTIPNTSNTSGFTVELDDGVVLTYSRTTGSMTFSGSDGIILNYSGTDNSRFVVSCTDYYIRHVKFADKSGNALVGTAMPATSSNGALDVDVDIDKAGSSYDPSKCFEVTSVTYSQTFGQLTLTLADHSLTAPVDFTHMTYNSDEGYYEVGDADGLSELSDYVNADRDNSAGLSFMQTADIAFSHETAWNDDGSTENNFTAIGDRRDVSGGKASFQGTYDGGGHTISGIRISKTEDYLGLFGYVKGGTVKNIVLADARISGDDNVGGIVGDLTNGTVSGCTVKSNVTVFARVGASQADGTSTYHGGIVGYNNGGTVSGCTSSALVTARSENGLGSYGGIVGSNQGTIQNCTAAGVVVPNIESAGAIVGYNGNDATFSGCSYHSSLMGGYTFNIGVGKYMTGTSTYSTGDRTGAAVSTKPLWLFDDRDNSAVIAGYAATYNGGTKSTAHGGTPPTLGTVTVTLKGRTLYKDGAWNTLCLPFDLALNDLPASMSGATVMELDRTNENANGHKTGFDSASGTLTLNFKSASSIEKRKPYIIKWTKADGYDAADPATRDIFEPSFLTINPDRLEATGSKSSGNSVSSQDGYVTFHGSHDRVALAQDDKTVLYLGAADNLYYPSKDMTLGAFRAYFTLNNGLVAGEPNTGGGGGSNAVRRFSLNFGDDETTGIIAIDGDSLQAKRTSSSDKSPAHGSGIANSLERQAWYTLDGRRLSGQPAAKGIYIVNGRKVVIK